MTLSDKHVAGLTLKMLGATGKMDEAKRCALEGLYALAQRDLEWVEFLKEKHGINLDVDYTKLRAQYQQAEVVIKNY